MQKDTFLFYLIYFLFMVSPFLFLLIARISVAQEIDSSFLSGCITASGILTGFLVSSAISKREILEVNHYLMLMINLGVFFLVLNFIFIKHLVFPGQPDISDFALVMVSVNANAFTAMIIAFRLVFHEFFARFWEALNDAFKSRHS